MRSTEEDVTSRESIKIGPLSALIPHPVYVGVAYYNGLPLNTKIHGKTYPDTVDTQLSLEPLEGPLLLYSREFDIDTLSDWMLEHAHIYDQLHHPAFHESASRYMFLSKRKQHEGFVVSKVAELCDMLI